MSKVITKHLSNDADINFQVISGELYVSLNDLCTYYNITMSHAMRDLRTVIAHDSKYKQKFNIDELSGIRAKSDLIDVFQVEGIICEKDVNCAGRPNRFGYTIKSCMINQRWAHLFVMYRDFSKSIEVYDAMASAVNELAAINRGYELPDLQHAADGFDNGAIEQAMNYVATACRISAENGRAAGRALARRRKEIKQINKITEEITAAAQLPLFDKE